MALSPKTFKEPLRDNEGNIVAPSPEAVAAAEGIRRGFFDHKTMALDALGYMYGPAGGLVSQISKAAAVNSLRNTMLRHGSKLKLTKNHLKRLHSAEQTIKKTPQEILDSIEDVRFDPITQKRNVLGSYDRWRKEIKLNPEEAARETLPHEITHHMHRTHPVVTDSRRRWGDVFNYIQDQMHGLKSRIRDLPRGSFTQANEINRFKKIYKAAPAEHLARRVGKRVTQFKGTMSLDDYLKIYDEEMATIKKALKKTAPKITKEAEMFVDLKESIRSLQNRIK